MNSPLSLFSLIRSIKSMSSILYGSNQSSPSTSPSLLPSSIQKDLLHIQLMVLYYKENNRSPYPSGCHCLRNDEVPLSFKKLLGIAMEKNHVTDSGMNIQASIEFSDTQSQTSVNLDEKLYQSIIQNGPAAALGGFGLPPCEQETLRITLRSFNVKLPKLT